MKKTLALLLTLVMLGSLAATLVSAESYSVNWEAFTNSRGMNVYIGEATDNSPVVDGFVEDGEYPYSKYSAPDQIYNYAGGEIDSGVTEYFAHDANYVYYAVTFEQTFDNRAVQWQFKPFNSFEIYGDSTDTMKYYYTRISWQARYIEDDYGEPYTNYFGNYAPSINGNCVPVPDVYGGEELICESSWDNASMKTYEIRLSKAYLANIGGCETDEVRVIPYFTYFHSSAAIGHVYTNDDLLALSEVDETAFKPAENDVGYRFMVLDTEDSAPEFTPPETPDIGEIAAGETKLVHIDEPSDIKMFMFTPTTSGTYEFYSTGDCVPMGMIFDAEGEVLATDYDSNMSSNFSVTYDLEAGLTYVLAVALLDQTATGSFAINIELTASNFDDDLWYNVTKEMGLHIYIGDYVSRAPIQDGIISNNEYAYSRTVAASEIYNYAGGEIQSGVTEYFAHDEDYVYYATVFKQANDNRAFQWQFRPFNTFDIYRDNSEWTQFYYSRISWQARYKVSGYGYPYTDLYEPSIHNNCVRTPELYNELICESQKTGSNYKTYEVKLSKAYLAEINDCAIDELVVVPYFTYFHSSAAVGHVYTAEDLETLYENGATVSFDTGVGEIGYMFIVLGEDPDATPENPEDPGDSDAIDEIEPGTAVAPGNLNSGEILIYQFTPTVSGKYDFYSAGSADMYGFVLDHNEEIIEHDDASGDGENFYICIALEAGKTYYFRLISYSSGYTVFMVDHHAHGWGQEVVIVEPTHTDKGVKQFTCNSCSETRTEPIAKLTEHVWDDGEVTREPTHTEVGVKTFTCPCGETKTEDIAKLTEHVWNDGEVTREPTHTEAGVKTFTCPCGETKTEDIAKLTEHVWDDGVITQEPTVEAEGVKTYTCECGDTRTEAIEKLTPPATTETTTTATEEATTALESTGGCSGSVVISALAMLPVLACGALLVRRKED